MGGGGGGIFAITRLGPISKFNFRQCYLVLNGLLSSSSATELHRIEITRGVASRDSQVSLAG